MMKIFGLVLALLIAAAGAGSAATAAIDVYADWNLIAAPLVPFNPDPYAVFDGWAPDYNLTKNDATTGGNVTLGIDDFGNVLIGEGYWFNNFIGAGQISYAGVPDGISVDGTNPTDMWVSLPGLKEAPNANLGGWHLIGCPFQHDVPLENIFFTDGTSLKSWADASGAGWVDTNMYFYVSGANLALANDGLGDDDQMRQGKGYWFKTYVDDLAMIITN